MGESGGGDAVNLVELEIAGSLPWALDNLTNDVVNVSGGGALGMRVCFLDLARGGGKRGGGMCAHIPNQHTGISATSFADVFVHGLVES